MTPAHNNMSYPLVSVSLDDEHQVLSHLYPALRATTMNPKKKYVCAKCKSRCDLHGLFEHMRTVHDGLLCQYCMKLFKRMADLDHHLRTAHALSSLYFSSTQRFNELTAGHSLTIICAKCGRSVDSSNLQDHVCSNQNDHCKEYASQFECPMCSVIFESKFKLELHLCQGQCNDKLRPFLREGKDNDGPSQADFTNRIAKVFKVLTGNQLALQNEDQHWNSDQNVKNVMTKHKLGTTENSNFVQNKKSTKGAAAYNRSQLTIERVTKTSKLPPLTLASLKSKAVKKSFNKLGRNTIVTHGNGDLIGSKIGARLPNVSIDRVPPLKLRASLTDSLKSSISKLQAEAKVEEDIGHGKNKTKKNESSPKMKTATKGNTKPNKAVTTTKTNTPEATSAFVSTHKKKESRSARMIRLSDEISICFNRLRQAVHDLKDSCSFCAQVCLVSVDSSMLLNHIGVVHEATGNLPLLESSEESLCRIRRYLKEKRHRDMIFTQEMNGQTVLDEVLNLGYKCSYCRMHIKGYDELFSHIEREHHAKVLSCSLCQNIFLSYGSYISHVCFGPPSNFSVTPKAKFRCKLCNKQDLSTFLDFQVHLRKAHNLCDICFQVFDDQPSLAAHCLQHSLERMCTKCFLTYDSVLEFRRHLHFKHENDQRQCGKCHQKTWPHVYHFCVKPKSVQCEVCEVNFDDHRAYRVHFRTHTGAKPYLCSNCKINNGFISKTLLWKHHVREHPELRSNALKMLNEKRQRREAHYYHASSYESVSVVKQLLSALIAEASKMSEERKELVLLEQEPNNTISRESKNESSNSPQDLEPKEVIDGKAGDVDKVGEIKEDDDAHDPLAAAVASIMGPAGSFNVEHSSEKRNLPTLDLATATPNRSDQTGRSQDGCDPPERAIRPLPPPGFSSSLRHTTKRNVRVPVPRVDSSGSNVIMPRILKPGLLRPPARPDNSGNFRPRATSTPHVRHVSSHSDHNYNGSHLDSNGSKSGSHMSGMWNQDLLMLTGGDNDENSENRYNLGRKKNIEPTSEQSILNGEPKKIKKRVKTLNPGAVSQLGTWDLALSESSTDSDEETKTRKRLSGGRVSRQVALMDHDYCHASFTISQEPVLDDLAEMGKILSNVAMGINVNVETTRNDTREKVSGEEQRSSTVKKKKKKKRKKKKKERDEESSSETENTELSTSKTTTGTSKKLAFSKPSSKLKYHMPGAAGTPGITPFASRPFFSSSSDEEHDRKNDEEELHSSDLDTDYEADELLANMKQIQVSSRRAKPSMKAVLANEQGTNNENGDDTEDKDEAKDQIMPSKKRSSPSKPALKLKIKLPPPPNPPLQSNSSISPQQPATGRARMVDTSRKRKSEVSSTGYSLSGTKLAKRSDLSLKMRHSLALNAASSQDNSVGASNGVPNPTIAHNNQMTTGVGDGNRSYCVCNRGDESQEMIACDGPQCKVEWFHFNCVGIQVPPLGKWFCPTCRLTV